MRKHPVATIINFCTTESRFIAHTLREASRFSRQLLVVVCDHFFDGSPEDRARLEQIYTAFPEALFIEYPFIPDQIPRSVFKKVNPVHFWHSLSRLVGYSFLNSDIETVLFLDADEVPDGERVQEWLDCSDYHEHIVLKMANYWYFRESRFRAEAWEDSVVLARKSALKADLLLHQDERNAIFTELPNPKRSMVTGVDGTPLFHHYSWVRTEVEMLKKVRTWGHRKDRDWEKSVREEFKRSFSGTDFVHGYRFSTVEPPHAIEMDVLSFPDRGKCQKKTLTPPDLLKTVKKTRLGKSLFFRLF